MLFILFAKSFILVTETFMFSLSLFFLYRIVRPLIRNLKRSEVCGSVD